MYRNGQHFYWKGIKNFQIQNIMKSVKAVFLLARDGLLEELESELLAHRSLCNAADQVSTNAFK